MGEMAGLGTIEVGMLRETFPEWCIFSTNGAWWATRDGLQVWTGPRSLLLRVISATDLTALAERLCLQEWLDGLDEEALAAMYRGALMSTRL